MKLTFSKKLRKNICYLVLITLSSNLYACGQSAGDTAYKNYDFIFKSGDSSKNLNGTLSIPKNFLPNGKIAVLVSPPLAFDRNYFGLFAALAHELCNKGISVLRFDNRSYTPLNTKVPTPPEGSFSMFDQSADVLSAVNALRNDPRFSKTQIGLVGHSEGGCAIAIAGASNFYIDFVVMLSSMGIKGKDLSIYQFKTALNRDFPFIDSLTVNRFVKNYIRRLNIISANESMDSIRLFMREDIDSIYHSDGKFWYGQRKLQEVINSEMSYWGSEHRIMYTKFDPQKYYPKIECPALIVFGKLDEKSDYHSNVANVEKLFEQAGKKNFATILADSTDHNYSLVKSTGKTDNTPRTLNRAVFVKIADWINKIESPK